MKTFARRRWRNITITIILAAAVLVVDRGFSFSLSPSTYLSGWTLFVLIVGLASYNLRKKFSFVPLGSSATWLQVHIYAGLLTFVLFLVHVAFRVPNGIFESGLAILYFAVFASGITGLILSRVIAQRLTTKGEELMFERIPIMLKCLRDEVQHLVLETTAETETSMIPEFYLRWLRSYFDRPRHYWQHLFQSARPRQAMLLDIESQDRYLNDREREVMHRIAQLVQSKFDLDYQYALQSTLKHWLFVHIPLTYGLLIFAVAHLLLVYAFTGGSR